MKTCKLLDLLLTKQWSYFWMEMGILSFRHSIRRPCKIQKLIVLDSSGSHGNYFFQEKKTLKLLPLY